MTDTLTRKCHSCKDMITIYRNNVEGIIHFQNNYYHKNCFIELATQKSQSKRGKPAMWKEALENIDALEYNATKPLLYYWAREDLNSYLLNTYVVYSIPNTFWTTIAELENGEYQGKKCKPVDMKLLLEAWKWAQKNLNKIAQRNKASNIGPKTESDRLRYDLAIVVRHIGDYEKYIRRTKEETIMIAEQMQSMNKFDYEKIYQESKKTQKDEDILNLMDDIF